MKPENISITVDDMKLNGAIFVPDDGAINYPAVCLCHGIPAGPYDPSDSHYPVIAQQFCNEGFVTLIFNFRGAGYSEGNFSMRGWNSDLKAAVDFLYVRPEVDTTRIAIIGFSAGASVGVCNAAIDTRIACIAAMACPAEFSLMKREQAEQSIDHFRNIGIIRDEDFPCSIDSWYSEFVDVSAGKCISGIAPRPLLIVHGRKDEVVPVDHAFRLFEQAGESADLVILGEAGHRLSRDDESVNIALEWFKRKLHVDHDSTKAL